MNPSIREIVEKWLLEHGYDGLWWDSASEDTCGCCMDDLMPCDEPNMLLCRAGYMAHWIEDGLPTWGVAEKREGSNGD